MVSLFSRTQTNEVLLSIIELETTETEAIRERVNTYFGRNRKSSDIRGIINSLEKSGFLDKNSLKLSNLMRLIDRDNPNTKDIYIANNYLDMLHKNGLAILPFLNAVRKFPDNSQLIATDTVSNGPEFGYHNLRPGNDVVAAMGNFADTFGLLASRSSKKGKYQLSPLGEKLLDTGIKLSKNRINCDLDEPCRKLCPSNAISFDKISMINCIECGICTIGCNYGAINIKCNHIIELNTDICKISQGNSSYLGYCDPEKIYADELILQNWIKSLLNTGELPTEIPGIGEYPDLVTNTSSSFIEVKKNRITEKTVDKHIIQVLRYQADEIITRTRDKLRKKKFDVDKPDKFVFIARDSSNTEKFLNEIKNKKPEIPVTFISIENLLYLNNLIVDGININTIKLWENLVPWDDNKNLVSELFN